MKKKKILKNGKKILLGMLAIMALLSVRPALIHGSPTSSNTFIRVILVSPSRPLLVGNVRSSGAQIEPRTTILGYRVRGVSQRMNNRGVWENTIVHRNWEERRTRQITGNWLRTPAFTGQARNSVRLRAEGQRLLANGSFSTSLFASRAW